MTTPKSKRSAPLQVFENYNFTRTVGPGVQLFPIASSAMQNFDNGTVIGSPTVITPDDEIYSIDIGFDFKFNENMYDRLIASTNGFVVLREKLDTGTFNLGDYLTPLPVGHKLNSYIKERFTTKGIMLCPWFDDLTNAFSDVEQAGLLLTQQTQIRMGLSLPPTELDLVTSGMKYARTIHPDGDRCLVVRWRSFASYQPGAVITFEVVLHESGKIEFGYDNRKTINLELSDALAEGATVGIFINDRENADTTYWRFRDLSIGLGHPDDSLRDVSRYGGAEYTPGYIDTNSTLPLLAAPYNVTMYLSDVDNTTAVIPASLNRKANWPGQELFCSVISFSPPENRRKVLPRKDVKDLDSKTSYPRRGLTFGDVKKNLFDDRDTLVYDENPLLNYPSMLPDQYLLDSGIGDLFSDLVLPGRLTSATSEQFVERKHLESHPTSPFTDSNRPDQDVSVDDPFFTGQNSRFKKALGQHLRSKTHIKMELPIHHKLEMFPTSSAIYYYNKNSRGFFIPQGGNAKNDIMDVKLATGDGTNFGLYRPEDARGFGPIGNQIASGSSTDPMGFGWASDDDFSFNATESLVRSAWAKKNRAPVMSRFYGKSVPNNSDYWSIEDETFTLPINQPFLLEKAVFEIPLQAGEGWLYDKTSATVPIGSASQNTLVAIEEIGGGGSGWFDFPFINFEFKRKNLGLCPQAGDFAGPAITVSLFNQHFSGSDYTKDLIMTGTIIPVGDNIRNVSLRQTWTDYYGSGPEDGFHPLYVFEPEGFLSFGVTPSSVVPFNTESGFTGSVKLQMEAGVSNGVMISYQAYSSNLLEGEERNINGSISFLQNELLTSPYIDLAGKFDSSKDVTNSSYLKTVDVFGRSSKGSETSGRSMFGNEIIIPQVPTSLNRTVPDSYVPNPLYVDSAVSGLPESFRDILDIENSPDFRFYTQFVVPVSDTTQSPYLVMPGDKLTLALSKMRPALASNGYDPISGLQTLDIFKGGLQHDVLINTGSIKVTFYGSFIQNGMEYNESSNQVLDTTAIHEAIGVEPILDQYDNEYMRSFKGSYLDDYITGSMLTSLPYPAGSRGKAFSKQNANSQPPAPSTGYHLAVDPSYSSRQVPWNEKTSFAKTLKLIDFNERIYDSMMPNISRLFRIDGASPVWLNFTTLPANSGVFSFRKNVFSDTSIDGNTSWPTSFPFESKYAGIKRQLNIKDELTARSFIESGNSGPLPEGEDKKIDSFFIEYEPNLLFADANAFDTSQIIGLNQEDFAKLFFGYGDFHISNDEVNVANIPKWRSIIPSNVFPTSPVIRGWKYGIYNALPSYSSIVFRRDRYGQLRDMLEQRLLTRLPPFLQGSITTTRTGGDASPISVVNFAPIEVKFVNSEGIIVNPELTQSSNLSTYVTSSIPYVDKSEEETIGLIFNSSIIPVFPEDLFTT